MNVLVVSNMGPKISAPLQGGFVEKQVNRLIQNGHQLSYFKLNWNGDSLIHKVFKYPVFFVHFFIKHIFSLEKFDIIHVHFYFPTIFCALFYRIFRNHKVKVIVTCHGSDVYSYQSPSFLYRKLSFIVDFWYFTSRDLAMRFYRNVNEKSILCAGYDDSVFVPNATLNERKVDCTFIGSLDYNKGVDRLIWLVENTPEVNFSVIGTGKFQYQLEQCAISNINLTILGPKTPIEVAKTLKQSKCLLSLSRNESFGLVMSEAHACGALCIATQTDGSSAQLVEWPYIVEQNNSEKMILKEVQSHIRDCLCLSSNDYQKMQEKAMRNVESFSLTFVSKEIGKKYKNLYLKNNEFDDVG